MVPPGYAISVFVAGLTTPINLDFTERGELLVGKAGGGDGGGPGYSG